MSDAIIDGLRSALSNQLDNNKNLRAQLKMTQDARDGYRESVGRMSKELKAKDERIAAERKERDDWRKAYHAVAAQRTNAESQLTAEREKVAELEDRFNEQAICAEEFAKATSEVPMLKAKLAEMEKFTRWLMSWIAGLDCHCEHTQSEMGSEAKCFKHMALDKHAALSDVAEGGEG